jgi:flagellar M-ring protein FliF
MPYVSRLMAAVGALGARRLVALAGLLVFLTALMLVSVSMLSRPVRETLYSGLDSQDVNLIGAALSEVGIAYDVNVAGDAVLVDFGKTAEARMLLAQRGLPRSDKSGYELFDKVGSLGLTSFMQHVTQVRALEGELIRTIQQLEGIRAARVHLALRPPVSFKNRQEEPSASIVVRTDGEPPSSTANAIRHIVAAAIPGLRPEHVTVMTTDGKVLAALEFGGEPLSDKILDLQTKLSADLQGRLERTLTPLVGYNSLRISAAVTLDGDKRESRETSFDPESKVERSTRVLKSSDESSKKASDNAVSVEQNVPQELTQTPDAGGDFAKKESKEETTNFEFNSKELAVQSGGYEVERLSIAVVLNRRALVAAMGGTADDAAIAARLKDIEALAVSAVGADLKRGDIVQVSAIDFVVEDESIQPVEGRGVVDQIFGNLGTIINSGGLILAIVLILVLGLRPALRMVLEAAPAPAAALPSPAASGVLSAHAGQIALGAAQAETGVSGPGNFAASSPPSARDKLNKVVEIDVDRAAQVLKQWLDAERKDAA